MIHIVMPYMFFAASRLRVVNILTCLIAVTLSFGAHNSLSREPGNLVVPAQFIRELALPGTNNHFLRPSRILADNANHEIYICDTGNSRILIFDTLGTFTFEFSVSDYCGAPVDIAVDSEGFIYVLASTRNGKRIFIFDYDGLFIGPLTVTPLDEAESTNMRSIAIDEKDRLFILDRLNFCIIICSTSGRIQNRFTLFADLDEQQRQEWVFGSISIHDNNLYLPVSSLGEVCKYAFDGRLLARFGHKGSTPGELNFPVSVAVNDDGIVMVLDKHRYNVVCFDQQGRFLGEFGGRGVNPGWFYHPTWLEVDTYNQIYIGQISRNRVQVCGLPDFIRDRNSKTEDKNLSESSNGKPLELDSDTSLNP